MYFPNLDVARTFYDVYAGAVKDVAQNISDQALRTAITLDELIGHSSISDVPFENILFPKIGHDRLTRWGIYLTISGAVTNETFEPYGIPLMVAGVTGITTGLLREFNDSDF